MAWATHPCLLKRGLVEGRFLSKLTAYLLEQLLDGDFQD